MNIPFIGEVKMKKNWNIIIALLAVLYIISPIDFIPDFIPVIGWIDDVLAGMIAFGSMFGGGGD